MHRTSVWICLCLLASAAGCGNQQGKTPRQQGQPPAAKVELQIKDFDQFMALVKSHQGKTVVVDCWSTS